MNPVQQLGIRLITLNLGWKYITIWTIDLRIGEKMSWHDWHTILWMFLPFLTISIFLANILQTQSIKICQYANCSWHKSLRYWNFVIRYYCILKWIPTPCIFKIRPITLDMSKNSFTFLNSYIIHSMPIPISCLPLAICCQSQSLDDIYFLAIQKAGCIVGQ